MELPLHTEGVNEYTDKTMNTQSYIISNGKPIALPDYTDFLDMGSDGCGYYERTWELRQPWEHWKTMTAVVDHETVFNS
jgi:hypothetical protein